MRVVSQAGSSSGARNRVGSMIIHDVDDGAVAQGAHDVEMDDAAQNGTDARRSQIPVAAVPGPATRTRTAVDSLRKICLGRPKALGGTGTRVPQRNVSTAQARRLKGSRSVPPNELPIREEGA